MGVLGGIKGVPNHEDARRRLVDYWIKTEDRESFMMSRRMIRDEGLLCGGSSGSAMSGAIKACKYLGLKKGDRCVVILADSTRNYMTKFLADGWMAKNGFEPTDEEAPYKPKAALAELAQNSQELQELDCPESWVTQHEEGA